MRKCQFAWRGAIILVILYFTTSCDQPAPRRVLAQVLESTTGAFLDTKMNPDSSFEVGQTIVTTETGTAIISLVPGLMVQLNPNTKVVLDELLLTKSNQITFFVMESRSARVRLLRGSVCAWVAPTITQTELHIELPVGDLVASQTTSFYVGVGRETVRVTTWKGEATVQSKERGPQSVTEGCFEDWSISTGMPLGPASDIGEQAAQELVAVSDAQQRFAHLLSKAINRIPTSQSR